MKLQKFAFLFLTVTLIMSCKTVKEIQSTSLNNKWVLKSMNGSDASASFPGRIPTIEFDTEKSLLFGNNGCNNYNGKYSLSDNKLSVPNLISTMMACVNGGQEDTYMKLLSDPSVLSINKNGELVFTQNGKIILVFEAKPLTVEVLKGEWELQSIQGATANVHYPNNVPTINFDPENMKVNGSTSCNSYNSSFDLKGKKITVNRLLTTRRACVEGMEAEAKFIELLSGESDIDFDNGILTLRRDGSHTLSFTRK